MSRTTRAVTQTGFLVAVLALGLAAPALRADGVSPAGEPAATAQPAADPQGGFVPVSELPQQEKLPAAPLLIGAYAFVWAALLVYVWSVWRRLQRVEREVRDLSARLATRQK